MFIFESVKTFRQLTIKKTTKLRSPWTSREKFQVIYVVQNHDKKNET